MTLNPTRLSKIYINKFTKSTSTLSPILKVIFTKVEFLYLLKYKKILKTGFVSIIVFSMFSLIILLHV